MKEELRNQVKVQRQSLSETEWLKTSLLIQERLLREPVFIQAKVILCYLHTDREVRTDLIFREAFRWGKIICLPYVLWQKRCLIPSRIYSLEEIDYRGIVPRPGKLRPVSNQRLDLVITPGVVFDTQGNRIGLGGGFFDRFFKGAPPGLRKVALAFSFQVKSTPLPVGEDDVAVDMIITEERIYYRGQ